MHVTSSKARKGELHTHTRTEVNQSVNQREQHAVDIHTGRDSHLYPNTYTDVKQMQPYFERPPAPPSHNITPTAAHTESQRESRIGGGARKGEGSGGLWSGSGNRHPGSAHESIEAQSKPFATPMCYTAVSLPLPTQTHTNLSPVRSTALMHMCVCVCVCVLECPHPFFLCLPAYTRAREQCASAERERTTKGERAVHVSRTSPALFYPPTVLPPRL